jgi:lipid A ethanolaminephosphotransferase
MRAVFARAFNHRRTVSPETVLVLVSVFWAVSAHGPFFSAALSGRDAAMASSAGFALALFVGLVSLHCLLMGLFATRWALKPLLAVLLLATALAHHYMQQYGVVMDPGMLRNVMRTDMHEARELIGWGLWLPLLWQAVLPMLLLWWVPVLRRPWPQALGRRALFLGLAGTALAGSVMAVFQPLASLTRNNKELRYLITPANLVWSAAKVAGFDAQVAASGPKKAIGLDAKLGPASHANPQPAVVVLVVGETARAANWGLNGYTRQTTPLLAALPVVNFPHVTACGTNTETSLPCMFAPVGRRDYDEARIRGNEGLLHVLARAGVGVQWRDNQSGCKGVCDSVANTTVRALAPPGLCDTDRCFDEGLLHGLKDLLLATQGTHQPQLLVLHQLGNHGPSYFRRVPPSFSRFQPVCESDELQKCTREEIVNAYDNALLYTDHVLAQLIEQLRASAMDAAVVFVSDHGESLGENNLYLHGLPYAMAPDVQKQVPMVMWLSDSYRARFGLDAGCLARRAQAPISHDHLFHTLLGLLDVRTALHEPAWDLASTCRHDGSAAVAAK